MKDPPDRPRSTNPDKMVIVVGSGDRYAIGLAGTLYTTLASLLQANSIKVIVVDGGISRESKYRRLATSGWFDSRSEEFKWLMRCWTRSPLAWPGLSYWRLRKKAAVRSRGFRPK